MRTNKKKIAKAFKLHWTHGSCEIPWEFIIYTPHKEEEKELCKYLVSIGYAYENELCFTLSKLGEEEYPKYPHWKYPKEKGIMWGGVLWHV